MGDLGAISLWIALALAAYSAVGSIAGKMRGSPALIESGQADLMLISWLGIDFLNQGERAYRLLGCELTYSGGLPRSGDTLRYDIHVDGHANHGDVRLFFFHYDCRVNGEPRLSVREGQAGFFTTGELDESMGILWTPEEGERTDAPRLDPPRVDRAPTTLDRSRLEALAAGDAYGCFGPGFERAQTHTRTANCPRTSSTREARPAATPAPSAMTFFKAPPNSTPITSLPVYTRK